MTIKKDIVIIGSGLTGLTLAYQLAKKGRDFLVLEKQSSEGGVIGTKSENGFTYETGPNSGVLANPEVADLFAELDGEVDLEIANDSASKRYILKNGKLVALPSSLWGGITTPLFRFGDKLRLLGEPFRARGTDPHETLASMVRRRMGQSFLDYAVDPFILGIYAGDPEKIVPKYALPKLYNLEQDYGSFIGGAIKKKKHQDAEAKKATREVFSVKGGLHVLVEKLRLKAGEDNFIFGVNNLKVGKEDGKYKLLFNDSSGEAIDVIAEKVVSAVDGKSVSELFPFIDRAELANIDKLHYTRVIEIAVGFNNWRGRPLDGFGALIPSKEKRDILGIMFMSTIFTNRAPEDGALLTLFMGGVRRQDLMELSDEEIYEHTSREVRSILDLDEFKPDLFKIIRYDKAIPQYYADSKERLESIERIQQENPGLLLAGNIRDGIGMADRIKQAKLISEEL